MGLSDDPDFKRQYDKTLWPALTARLTRCFVEKPRDEWAALFMGTDACVAPVLSPEEAAEHPLNAARQTWVRTGDALQAAPAPRFAGQPDWQPPPSPARDQHGDEIRAALDL
jgi:crotonobetainyl-CoA:carnitine CoA-transferase CaiB-like acyl-CoA transferase